MDTKGGRKRSRKTREKTSRYFSRIVKARCLWSQRGGKLFPDSDHRHGSICRNMRITWSNRQFIAATQNTSFDNFCRKRRVKREYSPPVDGLIIQVLFIQDFLWISQTMLEGLPTALTSLKKKRFFYKTFCKVALKMKFKDFLINWKSGNCVSRKNGTLLPQLRCANKEATSVKLCSLDTLFRY